MEQNPQPPPGGPPAPPAPQPSSYQPTAPPPVDQGARPLPPPMAPPPPPAAYEAPVGGYPTGLAAKNPVISLVISLVIPGVGTIMNGETGKGIAILIGYVVALLLILVLIGFLLAPAVWIYGMYDAYQGAKKWNVAHGFPPAG